MNSYFSSLDAIVQKGSISNRVRFVIQDVIDLRKRQWKPRHDDTVPKIIQQIRRDVHKEREDPKNQQFQRNMGPMGGVPHNFRMGDEQSDRGDYHNRKQFRKLILFSNTVIVLHFKVLAMDHKLCKFNILPYLSV